MYGTRKWVNLQNCSLGVTPGKPSNFRTGSIGTNEVSLAWDAPTEEADHIESYELEWDDNRKRVFSNFTLSTHHENNHPLLQQNS